MRTEPNASLGPGGGGNVPGVLVVVLEAVPVVVIVVGVEAKFLFAPGPPGQVQDLQEHLQEIQELLQDHV